MPQKRRDFLKYSSAAALSAAVPGIATVPPDNIAFRPSPPPERKPANFWSIDDPRTKELAAIAIDAAKTAGATYADVRLTVTREHGLVYYGKAFNDSNDVEHGAIGVRTLVDGAWGFTASALWMPDEAARLGKESVRMGKANAAANARNNNRPVELDHFAETASGNWSTPIQRDPFTVPWPERHDVLHAYAELTGRTFNVVEQTAGGVNYRRQEKTFATSAGAVQTQTLYWIHPYYVLIGDMARQTSPLFQPVSGGWEVFVNGYTKIRDDLPRLTEIIRSKEQAISPVPDRYDVVFDGYAMAHLLGNIVGVATELDRALGWEANAGGTSYVAPIEDMLGARTFAAPLLNVSANRSRPGASATVKWDDEGISPENYTIVQDGALVDYHTTREFAPMLAPWYQRQKRSIRSHGCSASQTAKGIPLLQCPNIVMHPGKGTTTFEDLVKSMTKGIVVCGGNVFSDRQKLNGEVNGEFVYEVRNGKRVSVIGNSEILFRAPEILKNIAAIGGAGSQVDSGITVTKGQPEQEHSFGVTGVPALIKNVVLTDILRKS